MKPYLCVIEWDTRDGVTTYGAFCKDLPANVNSTPTKEEAIEQLRDSMSLAIIHIQVDLGLEVPEPKSLEKDVDTSEMEGFEFVWLSPAPMNPVAVEMNWALKRSGLTVTEVAKRMNTSRKAVYRLLDPTYWAHSFDSVRRFADALDLKIEFKLTA